MSYYQGTPAGGRARYNTHGLMGPAILVTLGVLFLLDNVSGYPFWRTWPILLIVMGAVKVLCYVMPDGGSREAGQYPPPYGGQYPGAYGQQPMADMGQAPVQGPVVTPPPPRIAGELNEGKGGNGEEQNG